MALKSSAAKASVDESGAECQAFKAAGDYLHGMRRVPLLMENTLQNSRRLNSNVSDDKKEETLLPVSFLDSAMEYLC